MKILAVLAAFIPLLFVSGQVLTSCSSLNCPGGLCCTDSILGAVCYNSSTHACCDNRLLCGLGEGCCGSICYDRANYQCCSPNIIRLTTESCPSFNCANMSCGNQLCCNDISLGGVCYSGATHYCCDNTLLCPTNTRCCGASCYDPALYQCCSGRLQQLGIQCPTPITTVNPVNILNAALFLERLMWAYYNEVTTNCTQQDFIDLQLNANIFNNVVIMAQQHSAHIQLLEMDISNLGGNPVPPCTYNFNFGSAMAFIDTARVLEEASVSAMTSLAGLTTLEGVLISRLASISENNARHAAYLNVLQNRNPFPQTFESPITFNQIRSTIQPFILSCPVTISF